MNILGISGRYRDAAAALAVDGRIVAAASEDSFTRVPGIGYTQTGGFPAAAVDACLRSAGLDATQLDEVSIVEAEGAGREDDGAVARQAMGKLPVRPIEAVRADAVQAAATSPGARAIVVCGTEPGSMASFEREAHVLRAQRPLPGGDRMIDAARVVAATLGIRNGDSYSGIDRLSLGGEPEFDAELMEALRWSGDAGVHFDRDRLTQLLDAIGGRQPGALRDAGSLNVRVQNARKALAASFAVRMASVLHDGARAITAGSDLGDVAFGGAMFANARLRAELRRMAGHDLTFAAVPERAGRALGAALSESADAVDQLPGLALGPSFSDHDIKRTLDNCRLDYVYEPDWARLFARLSKMLAQGKVVGWFQGAMGFGPRAMGTRSILCDPSSRYARQNMNEYLRQVPLDETLPVIFAPSALSKVTGRPAPATRVFDAAVPAEWRDRMTAALDWRHEVRVHVADADRSKELRDLLETHYDRTGVPALIEVNLSGPGEPVACTPRDAVRTVYSSAIDTLVLGRFVLMKDYWLLRNNAE